MQILIIARDYKPLTGGIAEYTHQLAHQLHAAGDSVTVLAQIRPASAAQDAACGYAVERVDFSQLGERGPLALLQRLQLLQRAVQRLQPEIVICNVLGREAQAVRLVCRRHALPYVIFAYGREITRLRLLVEQAEAARYTRAMNAVLRDAARVVAISSYTHEQLLALNVAPAAIHLVRPGIDTAGRIPPGTLARLNLPPAWEAPATPVILTLARLVERKGIDTVVAALPQVLRRFPTLLYVIAGDGPLAAQLAEQVHAVGLDEHVVLTGGVTEAEKSALLARADLFVMPNRQLDDGDVEGFGIVFLEANLFAKPVIGGDSGGARDAIAHGSSGLLVKPDAPDALAAAIITLLEAPDLAARLGRQGAQRAQTEFNWSDSGAALRTCLLELVANQA